MAVSTRAKALQNLAGQMPGADQRFKAAQGIAVQKAVQQAGKAPGPVPTQTAGVIGAGAAAAGSEVDLAARQSDIQRQNQVNEMKLREQALEEQKRAAGRSTKLREDARSSANKLAQLDEDISNELFFGHLDILKDESKNKFMNTRHYAEFAAQKANNAREFEKYKKISQRAQTRKLKLMEMALKKLDQASRQKVTERGKTIDQQTRMMIAEKKKQMERMIAKEKRAAARRGQMFSAVGSAVGAVAGTFVAPGAGTVAGAQLGSAAGSLAANA